VRISCIFGMALQRFDRIPFGCVRGCGALQHVSFRHLYTPFLASMFLVAHSIDSSEVSQRDAGQWRYNNQYFHRPSNDTNRVETSTSRCSYSGYPMYWHCALEIFQVNLSMQFFVQISFIGFSITKRGNQCFDGLPSWLWVSIGWIRLPKNNPRFKMLSLSPFFLIVPCSSTQTTISWTGN